MDYSSYGMLALLVYVIIDKDVLFRLTARAAAPVQRAYRNYLIAVMCYFVTDILWGVLDYLGLITLLYADTVVYYVAMAASVPFDQQSMDNLEAGGVVISAGMATFDRTRDEGCRSVFIRADQHMYRRKGALKTTRGGDDLSRG